MAKESELSFFVDSQNSAHSRIEISKGLVCHQLEEAAVVRWVRSTSTSFMVCVIGDEEEVFAVER